MLGNILYRTCFTSVKLFLHDIDLPSDVELHQAATEAIAAVKATTAQA